MEVFCLGFRTELFAVKAGAATESVYSQNEEMLEVDDVLECSEDVRECEEKVFEKVEVLEFVRE